MPVVALLKIMRHSSSSNSSHHGGDRWRKIYSQLCSRESASGALVDEVPTTRCLEIAFLLSQAYHTAASFSRLIGGGFGDEGATKRSGGGGGGESPALMPTSRRRCCTSSS
jgi:hypothetical protein